MREEPFEAVTARIEAARSLFVLTGAGMSAESGIATFRDALTGLWSRFDPAQLASEEGFRADPRLVWEWYAERRVAMRAAQPNAGHLALAAFERRRPGALTLVSQNVDDLHQRAGNRGTIRLHGELLADRWLDRCARTPACRTVGALPGSPPHCGHCGNLVPPVSPRWRDAAVPSSPSSIRTTARSTARRTSCCAAPRRRRCRGCCKRADALPFTRRRFMWCHPS
jgi:NAD-dependent deacetylase